MKLVVDTNIVIAALLRDSVTRKILLHPLFSFYIPEYAFNEIERHENELLKKSGLTRHRFHELVNSLKKHLSIVPTEEFIGHYPDAHNAMKDIDETDAPFIALSLSFDNDGVWTNDAHFEKQYLVRVWSTADLFNELKELEEDIHY
jgi:predicted nucleic acid-binding protein